ncbi:MAG TPA: response regulator, partial [Gemmatimonadales bacterium]|nr:response regulator [Gemmatimonadales bacterium]
APALVTRHTLAEERACRRARILVAEDHPVNQEVVVAFLAQLGYRADIVADGRRAIEAVARGSYDLVLMDCQMPELDGFEASAAIRRAEGTGLRVPIIALTANAMHGDRQRCLAAGMDDYLSKPLDRERLAGALARWLPESRARPEPPPPRPDAPAEPADGTAGSAPPIELGQLRSIAGADVTAIRRYLELFESTSRSLMDRLAAALQERNGGEVKRLAHTLQGASGNVGANEVARASLALERAAAREDWASCGLLSHEIALALGRAAEFGRTLAA